VRLLPQRPPSGVGGEELETPERRPRGRVLAPGDRDDPGRAPQLTVGDDVEARALLQRDGLADRVVLRRAQDLRRDPALPGALASPAEGVGAEEAAYHVGSGCHRRSTRGAHHAIRGAYFSGRCRCTMWALGWCGRPPAAAPSTAG